jgi:S1-C subfamily serine protease
VIQPVTPVRSQFRLALILLTSIAIHSWFATGAAAQPGGEGPSLAYRAAMAKAVRAAAQQVLPSIVTVEIIGTGGTPSGEVEQDAPTSGVVVDSEGFILASSIVVKRPSASILVVLPDGTRHAAKVVSQDQHRDLVMLKIDAKTQLVPVSMPDQISLTVGQTTIAVGRYGTDSAPMVSRGVLSAVGRLEGIAIQTDARVSPSFYGGPLIDLRGNLLGVLIPAVGQGGAEDPTGWYDSGIAFAIPADVIAAKIERLKSGQTIQKGVIGIVSKSGDPYEDGTEIAAVRVRSPAEAAGIQAGDEVLEVAGQSVRRHLDIRQALGSFDAGEKVSLKLRRDGQPIDVEVTLAETIPPLDPQRLGLVVRERVIGDENESKQVIVDAVVPGSPASESFRPGDVLLKLGQADVADVETLRRLLVSAAPEEKLSVLIRRTDNEESIDVTPRSIAGPLVTEVPEDWSDEGDASEWIAQKIQIPDSANDAAYLAPKVDPDAPSQRDQLGLLVLLMNPGEESSAEEFLKRWADVAKQAGVVVCAIAAEDAKRWQPKEMEIVAKYAAAVTKQAAIDSAAVAIATAETLKGGKAGAADSMALAVAVSQSSTFFGVAVAADTRAPAVRLTENNPSATLQLLVPVQSIDDLPTWAAGIEKAGYPIVLGGELDQITLLRWARLLQAI